MVSVIMSVYNTEEPWLREAIESILGQTFQDFEFIIVLDAPSDNSAGIVHEYAGRDQRIRVIENEQNLGLTKSLNRGLDAAQGKYIARMDADDISLPDRFEKQVQYLEAHDSVVAVGCRCSTTNTDTPVLYEWIGDHELMRIRMLFRNVGLPHPTAMFRRSVLQTNGIRYTESIKKSQDYKLWVDLLPFGELFLMPEILFVYREHPAQVSANGASLRYAHQIALEQAEVLLGEMTEKEQAFHCAATEGGVLPDQDAVGFAKYLDRLIAANKEKKIYQQKKFALELDYLWCQKAVRRFKTEKKTDMLLSARTLRLLNPRLIQYTKENKDRTNAYIEAIKAFKHQGKAE